MIRHLLVFAASAVTIVHAADKLPTIGGVRAVASINGEPLGVDEYLDKLAEMHAEAHDDGVAVPARDPMALLDRMVQAKLILQEARRIGLDELPEYTTPLARFRKDTLRGLLFEREIGPTPPPEPSAVDDALRERFQEFEVALALFSERAEADAFVALLAAPDADFGTVARSLVAEGRATDYQEPRFLPRQRVRPEVAEALSRMAPGDTSEPLDLAGGIGVLRVTATRVPDDPEMRAGVERDLMTRARSDAIRAYVERLRIKRSKTDDALVESLDLDAEVEAYDAFLADERVITKIDGGEPVRVRDLARSVKNRMYHGVEQAAEKGRLGKVKRSVLDQLITEHVIDAEAHRRHLDTSAELSRRSTEFEDATLFGLFVARVIEPSVAVTDDEIRAYREAHIAEFTEPEMVRIDELTYSDPAAAGRALERLEAGADLRWMRENSTELAPAEDNDAGLSFDDRLLLVTSLPPGVRDALDGVPVGSYRLYEEAPDRHHVLLVRERVPPRPRPLEQVRDAVRVRVFAEKREAALAAYTAELRGASEIDVFVDRDRLLALATGGR